MSRQFVFVLQNTSAVVGSPCPSAARTQSTESPCEKAAYSAASSRPCVTIAATKRYEKLMLAA